MKKEGDIIIREETGEGGPSFLLLLGLLVWFAVYLVALGIGNEAVEEEQIYQQLEEHGVSTLADIKECRCSSKSHTCDMSYQYQVTSFGKIINHYGRDVARYNSDCKKRQVVRIKYLPKNPSVSKLEASYSVESKQRTARSFTYFSLFFISVFISYLIKDENATDIKHQLAIRSDWANSSRPQLAHLSRITKLPILLIVVLAWSKFFLFLAPLVEILELISIPLLIVIGVYFTRQIFPLFKLVQASLKWLPAKALITDSYIQLSHGPKKKKIYQLYIVSMYQIKDKRYVSLLPSVDIYGYWQLYFNSGGIARTYDEAKIRDIQKKYPVGQVVTVYYDPQKLGLVTDKRGFHPQLNTAILKLANLALFCWLFAYLIWVMG